MASSGPVEESETSEIEPYRLHVSQRYLDLTKLKLEHTRLPRDPALATGSGPEGTERVHSQWDAGVPKAEFRSLLDFWTDRYDHRVMEDQYNTRLPQFRYKRLKVSPPTPTALAQSDTGATVSTTTASTEYRNLHFVHRQSTSPNALPLLIIPSFGSSFIEIARVIESLTEPITTPTPQTISSPEPQAFHVVCASIPGFGFSDVATDPAFGLSGTADVLAALMSALGYHRFIISADSYAFLVARALALRFPGRCIGIHTADLNVPKPRLRNAPWTWLCYHIARLTRARIPPLSFGYVPADFKPAHPRYSHHRPHLEILGASWTQIYAYALADSPSGLLALIVHLIGPSALESLRHAPAAVTLSGAPAVTSSGGISSGGLPQPSIQSDLPQPSMQNPWSPSEVLLATMMYWLPGTEAPLHWLRNVARDSAPGGPLWRWRSYVPLGISVFGSGGGVHVGGGGGRSMRTPPAWATAYHDVRWVRRHTRETSRAMWEAPEDFVVDLRDFARAVVVV